MTLKEKTYQLIDEWMCAPSNQLVSVQQTWLRKAFAEVAEIARKETKKSCCDIHTDECFDKRITHPKI